MLEILDKYELGKTIGKGSYATVAIGKNKENGKSVAIKVFSETNFDDELTTKRALREILILKHLNGHENIINLVDCYTNEKSLRFQELYLVVGLMESDLGKILRSGQQLSAYHHKYFLYQILRGLKWMHSAKILHRDLKPGNLLVNSDCELRICDFGLARGDNQKNEIRMTEYVVTRFYRAPEIIFSSKEYSTAIDIWSTGCIFAEMMTGSILFQGKDYMNQLDKIFEVIGTPNDQTKSLFSASVQKYLNTLPKKTKKDFSKMFPNCDIFGIDLLTKMLEVNPTTRITAKDALSHGFVSLYHDPTDEPDCSSEFDFGFESLQAIPDIKSYILKEIDQSKVKGVVSPKLARASSISIQEGNNLPKELPPLPKDVLGVTLEESSNDFSS